MVTVPQNVKYMSGVRRPNSSFRRGGAAQLRMLTRAGEIGKAKYRGNKNRQGFNRDRSALSG
jgi:hypothetical protein